MMYRRCQRMLSISPVLPFHLRRPQWALVPFAHHEREQGFEHIANHLRILVCFVHDEA